MPVKGCRGSEVDDRHLNGGGRLNHQCIGDAEESFCQREKKCAAF